MEIQEIIKDNRGNTDKLIDGFDRLTEAGEVNTTKIIEAIESNTDRAVSSHGKLSGVETTPFDSKYVSKSNRHPDQ